MKEESRQKWLVIFAHTNIFIYGAGKTAENLYQFASDMGYREHIRGFLVSDASENVESLCGLRVYDVHSFTEKEIRILIPHMGVYKEQILALVGSLGFHDVILTGQLMAQCRLEERESIVVPHKKIGWEEYESKSEAEKEKDAQLRKEIARILKEGNPDFGGVVPYQSLEVIGLEGDRPTEYRIRQYGIREILRAEDRVLDIGCNTGFIDISVSPLADSVTGIEYDCNLVTIAEIVKEYLKIKNCFFWQGDFKEWLKENRNQQYDVICSFAIHHWLDMSAEKYTATIDALLKPGGYLCFESQVYETDAEFIECRKNFEQLDYVPLREIMINDDGMYERQYVLYRKADIKGGANEGTSIYRHRG